MASIGGDTNTLVRKFMSRKRKRTPADLKYPRQGQGENAKFKRFGRKPPGHIYPPAVVPGYGQYIHEKAARKIGQYNAQSDRSRPFTQPTGRSERAPYNPKGDYRHPRKPKRPRLD